MSDEGPQTDIARKGKGFAWLLAGMALAALFAFGISPLVRAIPWSWEQKLADHVPDSEPGKVCEGSPKAQSLLKKFIARLYPLDEDDARFTIDVRFIDNPDINAFAGLGGHITVYSGLLDEAQSPEELAAALAHEMEHVRRRHILEGVMVPLIGSIFSTGDVSTGTQMAGYLLKMSFSRSKEEEADEGGLERLQKAHIDTAGFKRLFERMKKSSSMPTFASDHPSYDARFKLVDRYPTKDARPMMSRKDWLVLQAICQK